MHGLLCNGVHGSLPRLQLRQFPRLSLVVLRKTTRTSGHPVPEWRSEPCSPKWKEILLTFAPNFCLRRINVTEVTFTTCTLSANSATVSYRCFWYSYTKLTASIAAQEILLSPSGIGKGTWHVWDVTKLPSRCLYPEASRFNYLARTARAAVSSIWLAVLFWQLGQRLCCLAQ
jgi:hypothetical protein